MRLLAYLCVGLLPLCVWASWPCPEADAIAPCTCTSDPDSGDINMDCSLVKSNEDLSRAFQAEFPFTDLNNFVMISPDETAKIKVTELTSSTFGVTSFVNVVISYTELETIDDGAFNNFLGIVETIIVTHSNLVSFPFDIVRFCPHLKDLRVFNNAITHMSNIHSDSLEYLQVSHNPSLHFNDETFQTAPNIVHLLLNEIDLQYVAPDTFKYQTKLQTLDLSRNKIVDLVPYSLRITSPDIKNINLQDNNIATVEQNSISVVSDSVLLWMHRNQITELPEAVWKPLFDSIASSSSSDLIVLDDNPIRCDCDIKWLVADDTYLSIIGESTTCDDGILLLDVKEFIDKHCP